MVFALLERNVGFALHPESIPKTRPNTNCLPFDATLLNSRNTVFLTPVKQVYKLSWF